MQRLASIEHYIQSRRQASTNGIPSIFREFGYSSSFAVRYFDQSLYLQELLSNINHHATLKRQQKHDELSELKQKYAELMKYYNNNPCETHQVVYSHYHGYTEAQHKPNCARCASRDQAKGMKIHIYEWPLSSQESTAKATVFELCVPQGFSDWRDASTFLLTTVLGGAKNGSKQVSVQYTLDRHHGLSHLLSPTYNERRIILISSKSKSHTVSHREVKTGIPNLKNDDVCPPNGLQYDYFDKTLGAATSVYALSGDVIQKCMYRMPSNRSKVLERVLFRPPSCPDGISPNRVIATLSGCPTHFSIDEFKHLATLPLGRSIIYINILAQLATPAIDFAKAETQTVILQIIEQSGPPSGYPSRTSHAILVNAGFSHAMLAQLEICLRRVAKNWESWRAVACFVALARRILGLNGSPEVRKRSLRFLAEARGVSMAWLQSLKSKADTSVDDTQKTELYSRATEIALLCSHTFDVDNEFVDTVLQAPSAISALLQCSMIVQENQSYVQSESQVVYKIMLRSWKSLMYRVFPRLRYHILQGNVGLHTAVKENWASFNPTSGVHWNILDEPNEHWLYIKSGLLTVYFDLLTGQLLVDGLPLARLPPEFMKHPVYPRLFGKTALAVAPTDYAGMKFSAKSAYRGFELHFGMKNIDMCVVAIKDRSV
jgi:hypothetical protein